MAPENLVGKTYAVTADENSRARNKTDPMFALGLPAERALRSVPCQGVALVSASEDHPAATFSFTFSSSLSFDFSLSPGLAGVRMMSSISPYSFAASDVRK